MSDGDSRPDYRLLAMHKSSFCAGTRRLSSLPRESRQPSIIATVIFKLFDSNWPFHLHHCIGAESTEQSIRHGSRSSRIQFPKQCRHQLLLRDHICIEAFFFVKSHNWNLDAAVSTFQDNNAAVLATATELGVENHADGADIADDVEAESNVAEHEKHTNLRTQDLPPERNMEASCGAAMVVFADFRSEDE
ncbi:hypothetical protein ACFX1R_004984 [Malus domestica]